MGLRFLHTADWHLGKRLHGKELQEDHERFFAWLLDFVEAESISLVLVSGDVFDLANPSSEARRQYYNVLVALHRLGCAAVVTGGNHDSPQVLNAPKALLEALSVRVVGGYPKDASQVLVPIGGSADTPEVVVAAIPYLRDADLREGARLQEDSDRLEAVRLGIERIFGEVAEAAKEKYPGVPLLGMGHLFTHGASTSESEREIQVGNLAGFDAAQFPDLYAYLALGHIHRPQRIGGTDRVQYSGSPIAQSFSERSDKKRVVVGEINGEGIQVRSVELPPFRTLQRITGTLDELRSGLKKFTGNEGALPTLLELEMREEQYDVQKVVALEELVQEWTHPGAEIVKFRVHFADQIRSASQLYEHGEHIQDLKPREVFERLLQREVSDDDTQKTLLSAFDVVLEEVYEELKVE